MSRVIISSTGLDLKDYRQAAIETCLRLGFFPIAMEFFESMGLGATEGSKLKMNEADLYVGIYAHRYGYIEKGFEKAVTEIEFDYAGERKLERLCFVADPKHPWPPDAIDYKNHERLEEFKSRVGSLIRAEFSTVDDFKAKLMHALNEWERRHPERRGEPPLSEADLGAARGATTPPRPALVIGREEDIVKLKARFGIGEGTAKRPLTVIRGWPGVGKTTLVTTLAHDPEVAPIFPAGVLWASVGEKPDPFSELDTWRRALTKSDAARPQNLEQMIAQVRFLLRDKRALLLVDDVWEAEAAAPFKVAGPESVTLITTRFQDVANKVAVTPDDVYLLDKLGEERALELLARLAPTLVDQHPEESTKLLDLLEGLPLAIRVAARLFEAEAGRGLGVADLLGELSEEGKLLEEVAPDDRYDPVSQTIPTVSLILRKSTDRLDEETRRCFSYLGPVAPKPATFDLNALRAFWQVDDARPTARKLADRGLLEPILGTGRFQMHALLVMHARSLLKAGVSSHG
jgi:NB-ARC domain/Domain of unknown function (DUF4062)